MMASCRSKRPLPGSFSKNAYEFGANSQNRTLILIDGKTLVSSCIDKGLGFRSKPVLVTEDLQKLIKAEEKSELTLISKNANGSELSHLIKKKITENDIRARILRIPKSILELIPENITSYTVVFENENGINLKLDKTRTYFAGVTDSYRKFGLLDKDGTKNSKDAFWRFNNTNQVIEIKFEQQ